MDTSDQSFRAVQRRHLARPGDLFIVSDERSIIKVQGLAPVKPLLTVWEYEPSKVLRWTIKMQFSGGEIPSPRALNILYGSPIIYLGEEISSTGSSSLYKFKAMCLFEEKIVGIPWNYLFSAAEIKALADEMKAP